ncbi:4a-hydroxytetrahydrobiopterin dehydratase [Methylocapsa sp. S129]|uniref:4a-hydroxytetrahydrobiopterin dehydratase n=1 Tax=Methylocapsa sp. S129 TaxID=1641869 RepID=UPI00131A64DB|nr:4a-hydroxytetrahydrobiopterin dehydratase [Methylocapsa sp. S129]
MTKHKILTKSEIETELKRLPDWSVKGTNIEASFELKTFRDAIAFIVQVAIEAEVLNHHPEFYNSYNKVSFSFCTHDVGNKITDADIEIASKISDAAHRFLSMK